MYNAHIIQQSGISNYSTKNQRDIILDTADNLTQIGQWARDCYHKEQGRIGLFLTLTRKNLNSLQGFPLSKAFVHDYKKFCTGFEKLEKEYSTGITDHAEWAKWMIKWGSSLTQSSHLL
ncbi:MAG: hypothetical protein AAB557_03740 [Patescibacteria group bacterium]